MTLKKFHEMPVEELAALDAVVIEYQIQESLAEGGTEKAATMIKALAIEVVELREKHVAAQNVNRRVEWLKTFRCVLNGRLASNHMLEDSITEASKTADQIHGVP